MFGHLVLSRSGEFVELMIGDELVLPGIPDHKMTYVGAVGPFGEDVVNAPKGQVARFVHLSSLPSRDQIRVGDRGTMDWFEIQDIQARAHDVVQRRVL